jgi:hypothetical protein
MKLLFQVDAAALDGLELVSVDREAPAMANEKATTVHATDRLDRLGLHLHPTNHWSVESKAKWFGDEQQICSGLHEIIPATHQSLATCVKTRRDGFHRYVHRTSTP